MCLLASERLPNFHHLTASLAEYVSHRLSNPSLSWLSPSEARKTHLEGDDQLDPELCIGPEEIMGTIMLSMYMTAKDAASQTAELAFYWARGWIQVSVCRGV